MFEFHNYDRLKAAFVKFIERVMRRIDYLALYEATVLKCHGNNTFDLQPLDERLPLMTRIPLRLFVPPQTIKVKVGARVLFTFREANPRYPIVVHWIDGVLEYLSFSTGQGHVFTYDDDRDNQYVNPIITVQHGDGHKVVMQRLGVNVTVSDKEGNMVTVVSKEKLLTVQDQEGDKIILDGKAKSVTLMDADGDTVVLQGKTVSVKAVLMVNIDAPIVNLGGPGGLPVAYVGSLVAGGRVLQGSGRVFVKVG
jgi:hypothetical protein